MKIVTSNDMKRIDLTTIERYGIASNVLMERAGLAVARLIIERWGGKKVLVLAGSGNNGGDGLVTARELHNRGYSVSVLISGRKDRLSPDCRKQYETATMMGVKTAHRINPTAADLHGAVVVDALFGTGLSRPISGALSKVMESVNDSGSPVVSVDIPSGISSDTGQVLGNAFRAKWTVTFGAPKRGHFLYPGAEYSGELLVEDIGFPRALFDDIKCNALCNSEMSLLMPRRTAYSHKGDYGHVLMVMGSRGKTGAVMLSSKACLRAGAGLVTLGVPSSLMDVFQGRVTEEMVLALPDTGNGAVSAASQDAVLDFLDEKSAVLALGPGLGRESETSDLVRELIRKSTAPMVVDADAINALQGDVSILRRARSPIILTPHPGEFSRLSGTAVKKIESDRIESAAGFAKTTGTYLILKGVPTVMATPDEEVFINTTGNPGMATAGSGDVLTGILAGLLAQGLSPLEASLLGVYLHGLAGDEASASVSARSVTASDIIESVPYAYKSLMESC